MTEKKSWLEEWMADTASAVIDLSAPDGQLLPELLEEAELSLSKIIKTIGAPTDDDAHDQSYRRVHFILGFCKILGLEKPAHVLSMADYLLDIGRNDGDYSRGSMDYVIKLSLNTSLDILRELGGQGVCDTDTSEIIEECLRYIRPIIEQENNKISQRQIPLEKAPELISHKDEMVNKEKLEEPHGVFSKKKDDQIPHILIASHEDHEEVLILNSEQSALLNDFCSEVEENLENISQRLIDLESAGGGSDIINDLFRSIHTVKGSARLLGVRKMEVLAHEMETLLGDLRNNVRSVDEQAIDLLIAGNGALTEMVREVSERGPLTTPIVHILQSLQSLKAGSLHVIADDSNNEPLSKPAAPAPQAQKVSQPAQAIINEETLRVPTSKLDDVLNTASEVFVTRIRLQSDIIALNQAVGELQSVLQSSSIAVETERSKILHTASDQFEKLFSSLSVSSASPDVSRVRMQIRELLEAAQSQNEKLFAPVELKLLIKKVDLLRKQLQKDVGNLEGLSSRLQSGAMNFRMVPVSQLFNRFPPLVRDMARQVGKRVRLEVEGNTTELDKVLIGQLVDPLIHIMRNSLDHGLEAPEERRACGKDEIGCIRLSAYYEGSYVVIEISDDGRGVNTEKVLKRAVESGLITNDRIQHMSAHEIMNLIFEPGFSTASVVSELSGRGVGMDVVKSAVQQMQGSLVVDSTPGKGTLIRIKMPLTLAVVGVVLVEERGYQFAVPVLNIVEVLSVPRGDIRVVSGAMVMNFRGRTLPVSALSGIMNFESSTFFEAELSVVVITDGEREIGIMVDRLMGRHDVLIKQFGRLVSKLPYLMGCTILSDSRLVAVLNVWEIIHNGVRKVINTNEIEHSDLYVARRQHSILVVDDSAIQRNRIATGLVRSGYRAMTAEDGLDALNKIRQHSISACCVDVFMPIIDGLEFAERLKEGTDTADIPVYMMSSRAIDQHYDHQRLKPLGVLGFFNKPFDVELLINSLDQVLLDNIDMGRSAEALSENRLLEGSPT
jgi:two-component system chemotaxis sensor kinase CheA